jgi:hypothetical protein
MRVLGLLALAAVTFACCLGAAACTTSVSGHGSLAEGVPTSVPSSTPLPSPTPDTATASPTEDPVRVREQMTCVLVQAAVKGTNDRFNAAKSRAEQISILQSGAVSVDRALRRSQLRGNDGIYQAGGRILVELRRLITAANRGGSPSTEPYNKATAAFRTRCDRL